MNRINLAKHVVVVFAGVIPLFWTLYFMVSPLKLALGPMLFITTVVVGEILLSGNQSKQNMQSQINDSSLARQIAGELAVVLLFALSLLVILFVPATYGKIFVEWSALELPTAARLLAAFGMNFFPGYLILAILGKHRLGKLSTLTTSFFLSLLVLSVTGFVSGLVRGIIDGFFLDAFFIVCVALLVAFLLRNILIYKSKLKDAENSVLPYSSSGKLSIVLLGLTVGFVGIWLFWMYSNMGFFIGTAGSDMWRSHSYAQTFIDYRAFAWLNLPWWFNLYLASYFFLSGAPSANAFMSLYPLIALSILSFYLMVSSLVKDKKIASIATLAYTIFEGPAWLYALYLRNFSSNVNYSDWTWMISSTGDKFYYQGWYPPFVSGFNAAAITYAALWWMVYATFSLNLRQKTNFLLLSIVVALSYLLHGIDPLIFVMFLLAYLLFAFFTQNSDARKRVRLGALSVIVALLLVSVIDLSLTSQYNYFSESIKPLGQIFIINQGEYYYFGSPSFYALALGSVLLIALTYFGFIESRGLRLYHFALQKLGEKAISIKRRSVEVFFYLYGLTFIVWVALLPSISAFESAGSGWVPWYVYPVLGGVPLLFGLLGAALLVLRWRNIDGGFKEILAFSVIAVVLLFFFGQMISFVNERFFYTGFWERRTLGYVQPMVSILMAYALVTLLSRVHVERPRKRDFAKVCGMAFVTSIIVIASVSSTLMAADYDYRMFFSTGISDEELEALTYLHYSLPSGAKTAYVNRYTGASYIRAFASDKFSFDTRLWLGQFSRSPSSSVLAIRQSDAKYLYLNRIRDANDLKNNLFLQQLIRVLPITFNNSEVTIYSIPPLRFPSAASAFGVVSQEEAQGESYDAYVLWFMGLMMSGQAYSVIANASNPTALQTAKSVILPFDPLPIEGGEQLLKWVSEGGHLVVSNTNPYGMFTDQLNLTSKVPLLNCDSADNWRTAYVPKRGTISVENSLKIEGVASLRLQNNLSSWEEWIYTPPTPWNISQYELLGIWVYGNGGGPISYFYLTDSSGNEKSYRYDLSVYDTKTRTFVPSFSGWKMLLIPIQQYFGGLDLTSIKAFRIVTGFQLPLNILIDDIFLIKTSAKEDLSIYANGVGAPLDISFPSIEVQGLDSGSGARVIANYTQDETPVTYFAIEKDIGDGTVTYLNMNSLFQAIISQSGGFPAAHEVLTRILEMIGIANP